MTLERQITLEEFLAQPETRPYWELLNGRVVEKAMPKKPHSALQARLAQKLLNWVDEGGHGEVLTEQRCILTTPTKSHVQLPDVAWFARPADLQDGNVITPPSIAIEILSPDDSYTRVKEKLRIYLEAGTQEIWLVDPEDRSVAVRRRSGEDLLWDLANQRIESPLLPGFHLGLDDLFKVLD